uniref:rod shape-determining protein n=1 Tax=Eubacterium cellulosolvens TaxID=29322 RepID=UPI0004833C7F|nr:rod shape-determining protein [[Eubacterium] cellulosolvens]
MPVTDIGIDLGTATIIVYVKGRGVLYQEPSIAAYDKDANKILAFGTEAAQIIGRTPGNIVGIRPLKNGVISDFVVTERMLRHFIRKSMGFRNILKPRICICVPSGVTDIEKRAVEEASYRAGARDAVIVREPVVAAMGAGVDIMKPCGTMVVNIGGGVTEIAVVSLGGIVVSQTLRVAGESFDAAIRNYVSAKYDMFIGEQMAQEIKISLCSVSNEMAGDLKLKKIEVRGRKNDSGVPASVTLTAEQAADAVAGPIRQIVDAVHGVIEKTPPDLAGDIAERGIILTGGGAMIAGMEKAVMRETGIRTILAENPQQAVAIGTGGYIQALSEFEKRRF